MTLADPMDHPWYSPTSTAIGEGDAGHGEAATVLDAEDLDGEGVGHIACREMRSEAHSKPPQGEVESMLERVGALRVG